MWSVNANDRWQVGFEDHWSELAPALLRFTRMKEKSWLFGCFYCHGNLNACFLWASVLLALGDSFWRATWIWGSGSVFATYVCSWKARCWASLTAKSRAFTLNEVEPLLYFWCKWSLVISPRRARRMACWASHCSSNSCWPADPDPWTGLKSNHPIDSLVRCCRWRARNKLGAKAL